MVDVNQNFPSESIEFFLQSKSMCPASRSQGIASVMQELTARGESRVESCARDLRSLARHEEESMPGHR